MRYLVMGEITILAYTYVEAETREAAIRETYARPNCRTNIKRTTNGEEDVSWVARTLGSGDVSWIGIEEVRQDG